MKSPYELRYTPLAAGSMPRPKLGPRAGSGPRPNSVDGILVATDRRSPEHFDEILQTYRHIKGFLFHSASQNFQSSLLLFWKGKCNISLTIRFLFCFIDQRRICHKTVKNCRNLKLNDLIRYRTENNAILTVTRRPSP